MAYIVPRVLIKQEFEQVPVFSDQPLAALIIGPQYNLNRYSVATEKLGTAVSDYVANADTTHSFPNQEAGTFVDNAFTKVFFEKAQATYFPSDLGTTAATIERVLVPNSDTKYFTNRFRATNLVFKTANGQSRSVDFAQRDVVAGDLVTISNGTTTLRTKIKALHATKSDPVVHAATADVDNTPITAGSHTGAVTSVKTNGSVCTVTNISSAYAGAFNYVTGAAIAADTITATVTTTGNISDARFTVTSLNGAFAPKLNVQKSDTDNLILDGGLVLELNGSTNFVAGDSFSISVTAPVVASNPVGVLPFTGSADLTYKLTVVRGGAFLAVDGSNAATCARVSITSNNIDASATVSVLANTAFKVGTHGLTASFANGAITGGLIAGDVYYIPVTAATDAKVNIIETYDSIPTGSLSAYSITDLSLVKDLEIKQAILGDDNATNWSVAGQTITINRGIVTYDAGLAVGDALLPLPITTAKVFVEHRDLVVTNSTAISSVTSTAEVVARLGTVDPANPLAQGVYDAVLNSAGVVVYYVAVGVDSAPGYDYAIGLAKKSDHYYSLVPLTHDKAIQDAIVGHVNAMSTPEVAKWRIAWLSLPAVPTALVYDLDANNEPYQATITDNPLIDGNQFTLVTVAGAKFVTDDVRPTDKVLINFHVNSNGDVVSDEYVVSSVLTETTLLLVAGPAAAINSATKVQIKRVYTTSEQSAALAAISNSYNNRRVRAIFPDTAKNGNQVKAGYFIAAACAGLRSGVVPHQGLTNTELLGITDLTEAVVTFGEDDLNTLAEGGVWIITQPVLGATPYVRQQLTTASDSLNTSEDSITTNVDSISYALQKALEPFIGQYNVNPTTVDLVRYAVASQLQFRLTETSTTRAGNQLLGYKILTLGQDATFKDRINVQVQLQVPYPVNFVVVTLLV